MQVTDEVATALAERRAVVALESTIIAHGLPRPDNLRVAREVEATVREHGAVPATIAVLGGEVRIGLDDAALERLAGAGEDARARPDVAAARERPATYGAGAGLDDAAPERRAGGGAGAGLDDAAPERRGGVAKCGVRDLAPVLARGGDGATTVAATSHLAARAGIRVFATGGLGGVHRGARETFDESADLTTLARVPICVVCAGVKSILDVPATLERLETLNVAVVGYRTDHFPAFYLTSSGLPVPWRVETPADAAAILRQRDALGVPGAVVVANPLDQQMDPELHERTLQDGLRAAAAAGVSGRDVTPFLLDRFHRETSGASLRANIRLILRNAALAARIAAAL